MIAFIAIDPAQLATLQGEIVAALVLVIPALGAAIYATLQAYVNKQKIQNRPTHNEVSDQINDAVNKALVTNGNATGESVK